MMEGQTDREAGMQAETETERKTEGCVRNCKSLVHARGCKSVFVHACSFE